MAASPFDWRKFTGGPFVLGLRDGLPIALAAAPFGLLFGAIAAENGMSSLQAFFMSASIFAGASQMVGVELFSQNISPWLIVFSIFAVNFRHILYSANLSRHFAHFTPLQRNTAFFFMTDPQFAIAEQRGEVYQAQGKYLDFSWYMGVAMMVYIPWAIEGYLGAEFGKLIDDPYVWGIGFLLSVFFLVQLMAYRKRPRFLPIVTASAIATVIALQTVGSPWHVSIGALAGIAVAVVMPVHTSKIA